MVSFRSYEWEGKGFKYYVKDTIRNRPGVFGIAVTYLTFIPATLIYLYIVDEKRALFYSRFRPKYIVYRDDDPRVRNVIRLDENGNRIFLEPRKN